MDTDDNNNINNNYMLCMQNRELSWLEFNKRVLDEANYEPSPLFERLKFIAIFTSNLDEFYRVRVGSLLDYAMFDPDYYDNKTGMTAKEQLSAIYSATTNVYRKKDEIFTNLSEKISKFNVNRVSISELSFDESKIVEKFFKNNILPLLSPQVIDNRHPFPHIDNKQLNIAVMLSSKNEKTFGIIPVPNQVDRVLVLPNGDLRYLLVEDIILHYSNIVFKMYHVTEKAVICVTRNADIDTDVGLLDEDIDYRQHMKKVIKKRAKLSPVRLEIGNVISDDFIKYLTNRFKVDPYAIFFSTSPLDMSYVFSLESKLPLYLCSTLCTSEHVPSNSVNVLDNVSMVSQIAKKDLLLSYPYESMDPFIRLIKESADDPNVVSIKITLYRISRVSKIGSYLIRAAENGKDVTVLMELRARFDEENNIEWSGRMVDAGCTVVYGLDGYKVHSKICLITRKEQNKIVRYTQVGTGNYNEKTAKLYTDLSIMTANQAIGQDADEFFKNMSMSNLHGNYTNLWIAPNSLKNRIMTAIDEQAILARSDSPLKNNARIIFKLNSFTDKEIMEHLIRASQSGVKIDLIVRGICCLVPNIPGYTENINVISIVGKFLEHARIYCFGKGDSSNIYIASADMMTRNTQRRVEIACPILDSEIKMRIYDMLLIMLKDNVKSHVLQSDKIYILKKPSDDGSDALNSQDYFIKETENAKPKVIPVVQSKVGFSGKLKNLFNKK